MSCIWEAWLSMKSLRIRIQICLPFLMHIFLVSMDFSII
jgi:hypothetical protein